MHETALHNEFSLGLKKLHDVLVRLLDVLSNEVWHFTCESTRLVNGTGWHLVWLDDAIGDSNAVIVITEGWCLMYDTSTAVGCDVCVVEDAECSVSELI